MVELAESVSLTYQRTTKSLDPNDGHVEGKNLQIELSELLGRHGSYSFFKSIKIASKMYSLASFFPVKIWSDSTILSIAEMQLLWTDKNESFASLRLYFLPENTPEGRLSHHGEDEVIALQDSVIIRAADLTTWIVESSEWDWGFVTPPCQISKPPSSISAAFVNERYGKKKCLNVNETDSNRIVILNYDRYVRLRSMLKRLDGSIELENWLTHPLVLALGSLAIGPNCRVLFTKETFEYPELEDHELLCNHLAPKLKGKVKRRKRKRYASMGSESNGSETSSSGSCGSEKVKKPMNGMVKNSKADKISLMLQGKNTSQSDISLKIENDPYGGPSMNGSVSARTEIFPITKRMKEAPTSNQIFGVEMSAMSQKVSKTPSLSLIPLHPDNEDASESFSKKCREQLGLGGLKNNQLWKTAYKNKRPRKRGIEGMSTESVKCTPSAASTISRSNAMDVSRNWTSKDNIHTSPSMFLPRNQMYMDPKIFCTPKTNSSNSERTRPASSVVKPAPNSSATGISSIHALDLSHKKIEKTGPNFTGASCSPVGSSSQSGLLDLSVKNSKSGVQFSSIPPPDAMGRGGLRLTSEVTLHPCSSRTTKDRFASPVPSTSMRVSSPATVEKVKPRKPTANSTSSAQWSSTSTQPYVSSIDGMARSGATSSIASAPVSSKPVTIQSIVNPAEAQRELIEKILRGAPPVNNPMMAYYPKIDPMYLQFMSQPMLPYGMLPNMMSQDIERHIQMYKDLIMQAQTNPQLPSWHNVTGNPEPDRRSKS